MDLNELQSLNIRELTELAQKLNIEGGIAGLNKQELTVRILEANAKKDGSFSACGVLEVMQDGYGFLRSPDYNYMPGPDDIYVSPSQIRKFGLRTGDSVEGEIRAPKDAERYFALLKVSQINFETPEKARNKRAFDNLTPLYPDKQLKMEVE